MAKIFLSLGSNLGNKEHNLQSAIKKLSEIIDIKKTSSIYQTEPTDYEEQPNFLNLVIEAETNLSPEELIKSTQKIQKELGTKEKAVRYGPRIIDIDILFYNDLIMKKENLTIPHPRLHERAFVLVPFAEIAPGWIHPSLKKSIVEIKQNLKDRKKVIKIIS